MSEPIIKPPFGYQCFDNFSQWVNYASVWLTCHDQYNNTENGETKGWRGHHFTALCFDSFGRRCTHGADFMRARDEGTFPIWWIWPDQIVEAITNTVAAPSSPLDSEGRQTAPTSQACRPAHHNDDHHVSAPMQEPLGP